MSYKPPISFRIVIMISLNLTSSYYKITANSVEFKTIIVNLLAGSRSVCFTSLLLFVSAKINLYVGLIEASLTNYHQTSFLILSELINFSILSEIIRAP